VLGDADQGGEILGGQAAAPPSVQKQQTLLRGERLPLGVLGQAQPHPLGPLGDRRAI